jgi:hypothetical protein
MQNYIFIFRSGYLLAFFGMARTRFPPKSPDEKSGGFSFQSGLNRSVCVYNEVFFKPFQKQLFYFFLQVKSQCQSYIVLNGSNACGISQSLREKSLIVVSFGIGVSNIQFKSIKAVSQSSRETVQVANRPFIFIRTFHKPVSTSQTPLFDTVFTASTHFV